MAANRYKVPQRQWRKWADIARGVFNRHFSEVNGGQHILAPGAEKLSKRGWRVLAWNSAWLAADATMDALNRIAEKGTA